MYEVIKAFRDMKNDDHLYQVGDTYPVNGYKPTKSRIQELLTDKNRLNEPLLKEIPDGSEETPDDEPNG